MKKRVQNIFKAMIAIVMIAALVCALPATAFTSQAAGNYLKQNGLKTNLKKGKKVSFQSYVDNVGYITCKATLKKIKKNTVKITTKDGRSVNAIHVKGNILIETPKLTQAQVVALFNSNSKYFSNLSILLMDVNSGYWAWDKVYKSDVKIKKIKTHGDETPGHNYTYPHEDLYTFDFYLDADTTWALGIGGGADSNIEVGADPFIKGNTPYTKSTLYYRAGKNLSVWKILK